MEATGTRGFNRAAVLASALDSPEVTRSSIETQTGLSKATVSRLVDELIQDGMLTAGAELHREGRGRKSLYLELGPRIGCVVGVDLGITTTRLWCCDLRGNRMAGSRFDTPHGLSRLALVRRLVEAINDLVDDCGYAGRLAGSVVAVASSVRDHGEIVRPAEGFAHIAGSQFGRALERHLAAHVLLDSDSNMALCGEMANGGAVGAADVALLTLSTGFGGGFARGGEILRGDRCVIGELGSMPMVSGGVDRKLDDVLSARGVLAAAQNGGVAGAEIADIAAAADDSVLGRIRASFADGLVVAVSAVTLTLDPEIIVFNGRMLPVVARVLSQVRQRLGVLLPAVPDLVCTDSDGYSGAHGAAITAARYARARLLDQARVQQMTDAG